MTGDEVDGVVTVGAEGDERGVAAVLERFEVGEALAAARAKRAERRVRVARPGVGE